MRSAIHELGEQLGERLATASAKPPQKDLKGTLKSYIPRPLSVPLELRDAEGAGEEVILSKDIATALNNSNDFIFGLRPHGDKRFIGDTEVDFNNDKITIKGKAYKVTNGLLILLTRNDVKKDDYNKTDLEKYKEILIRFLMLFIKITIQPQKGQNQVNH